MSIEAAVKRSVVDLDNEYKDNGFLLFSMGLKFNTMDYEKLFTEDVLDKIDGKIDDKKIDFFHLDPESGIATIAQSYYNRTWDKAEAPANKAADLNTAVNWLLDSDISSLSDKSIKAQAIMLRDALENNALHTVELLYIHNCPPAINVKKELAVVEKALQKKLHRWHGPDGISIKARTEEVSFDIACLWYDSKTTW